MVNRKMNLAVGAVLALVLGTVAGCGSDAKESKGATSGGAGDAVVSQAKKADSVAAMLPSEVASSGELRIATDPNYPPFEYYDTDNKTVIGLDVDMGYALGRVLGVQVKFTPVSFDGIIPGIAAGKYQAAMSFLGDIKERQATVDFVDYLQDTTSLMVASGNPLGLSINNLCGKSIAVQKGSTQDTKIVPELSSACTGAGKQAIDSKAFPSQDQANLAVTSKRADGSLLVTSVVNKVVSSSNGQLERVPGDGIYPKKYGIVLPKGSALDKPLQAALQELDKQGVYAEILKKWKQAPGAITDFTINDPEAQ